MEYKECVSPCAKTCQSLNINEVCQGQCADGCSCPGNLFTDLFTQRNIWQWCYLFYEKKETSVCLQMFLKSEALLFVCVNPRIEQFLYCLYACSMKGLLFKFNEKNKGLCEHQHQLVL